MSYAVVFLKIYLLPKLGRKGGREEKREAGRPMVLMQQTVVKDLLF